MLDVLVDLAAESPGIAQLLMREGLAAGPRLLGERERLVGELAVAAGRGEGQKGALDIPVQPLFGGVFRFIARRLDAGENAEALRLSIHEWVDAFGVDAGERRWSEEFDPGCPRKAAVRDAHSAPAHGLPEGADRPRNRRDGAGEGVSRNHSGRHSGRGGAVEAAFYNAFDTKEAAVIATYEYAFQQTVAACTPAFFDSGLGPSGSGDAASRSRGSSRVSRGSRISGSSSATRSAGDLRRGCTTRSWRSHCSWRMVSASGIRRACSRERVRI